MAGINKALAYIDANLDQNLSLSVVAEVANYSPFHFHRIFTAITNEPLNAYITRKRIEKAASYLLRKKEITVTDLALKYGFSSNASFTRAFKKFYGISPTRFRDTNPDRFSKVNLQNSKIGQVSLTFESYICNFSNLLNWLQMNATIEVKELPELHLAYITTIGDNPEQIGKAYQKLINWATPKGLMQRPDLKMITVYHDSFKVTDPTKVRLSAGMLVQAPLKPEDEIGALTIAKGKCITGRFEIKLHEFEKAWTSLFMWMNENGYKIREQECFEIYHNDFKEHPEGICMVDLCIPIS